MLKNEQKLDNKKSFNHQITIIIVTYKSAHIIENCLKTIINNGYKIIIVDNNSNDNLAQIIHSNYDNHNIELIKLPHNIGFGRANNVALQKVTTKFAFLLNPDATITQDSLNNLAQQANDDNNIALAGCFDIKKLNPTNHEISKEIETLKKKIKIIHENENYIQTTFICGGYMLLRMDIFKKIGFFDENIFLYAEDEELCDRAIANNYKVIQVKNSICFHNDHSSTYTNNYYEEIYMIFKRYYHMGWSRTYIKKKRGKKSLKLFSSLIFQLISSPIYLISFRLKDFIKRFARSVSGFSNLLIK